MINEISSNPKIQKLFVFHAKEMIETLKEEGLDFSIACDTQLLTFDPPLSLEMQRRLGKVSIFILSGYSFESIQIFDHSFVFEAGLISNSGEDIGTIIQIPYMSIVQILAQDEQALQSVPLFINPIEQNKDIEDSIMAILSKNSELMK